MVTRTCLNVMVLWTLPALFIFENSTYSPSFSALLWLKGVSCKMFDITVSTISVIGHTPASFYILSNVSFTNHPTWYSKQHCNVKHHTWLKESSNIDAFKTVLSTEVRVRWYLKTESNGFVREHLDATKWYTLNMQDFWPTMYNNQQITKTITSMFCTLSTLHAWSLIIHVLHTNHPQYLVTNFHTIPQQKKNMDIHRHGK